MKEPKILSMSQYSMGLVDAAEGSKAVAGSGKKIKKPGGGLIAAARGSKTAADLTKRKKGKLRGGGGGAMLNLNKLASGTEMPKMKKLKRGGPVRKK